MKNRGRPQETAQGKTGAKRPLSLREVAHLRQWVYCLFSQSLLYPDEARLETLAIVAREMDPLDEVWSGFAFAQGWSRFLACLKAFSPPCATRIEGEYLSLFLVDSGGAPCPIYELAYLEDDARTASGLLLAQLEREYRLMGLSPSPDLQEPQDHAAVELEFMSFLCGQEAEAWSRQSLTEAVQALERERAFLANHLTRWFPLLASRVAAVNCESRFAVITETTRSFLLHDRELLSVFLDRFQSVTPRLP